MEKVLDNIRVGNVVLNMEYYSGRDEYSDGDIEDVILQIVKDEEDFEQICYTTEEFAIYYHLTKERELIVEPMNITKDDTILEVGAGCGAITGAMAERAGHIDCIDLSTKRSLINAYRHKNLSNISIYVANYEDVQLNKQYDIITLIGVFEYSNYYIHTQTPYYDFLLGLRKHLKDDGRLYIAIENRLGIKYFAGCREDHNGEIFSGIEGYVNGETAKTFSSPELDEIFEKCGFSSWKYYYPYPDYKFPIQIFSDNYLPAKGSITQKGSDYNKSRVEVFDELKFWNSISHKEEMRMFSNSFLVELRR